MSSFRSGWHIIPDATDSQAVAILVQDPVWNSFGLADVEPPMREYNQFAIAIQDGSDRRALCSILRHPIIGEVLSPYGDEDGVAALMGHLALPEHPVIQTQEMHLPSLQSYYQPETDWQAMLRMAIPAHSWQALPPALTYDVRQLTDADLPALKMLYAQHSDREFSATLFAQSLYFGAFERARIVAACGTHALSSTYHLAVLGNVFTAPETRGQGYATAVIAAMITALFEWHCSFVVLNVFADNLPAIRVYQRLGFQTYHTLLTGKASLLP